MDDYSRNVMVFIILIFFIMIILSILGIPIYIVLMFGVSVVIIVAVLKYFSIDLIANIASLFIKPEQKTIPPVITPTPTSSFTEEVFNIPEKKYNYSDAKLICQAFNSRLANFNDIKEATNSGAEWCNYGWTDKQMALMPTQESTYNKLQDISGHENDCGRPGINGGYVKNPNEKYSANCFGVKPKITALDEQLMQATVLYPKTEEDILLEQKVDDWKNKLNEILVSPFNHNKWAMTSSNYITPTPTPTPSTTTASPSKTTS
jgi:hypothetical protein